MNTNPVMPTAEYIARVFDVPLATARQYIPALPPHHTWEHHSIVTWIRNRLHEDGLLKVERGCDTLDFSLYVTLHVFALFWDETPEMLRRLKRDTQTRSSSVARSKISKTALVVTPIDVVAQRVFGND